MNILLINPPLEFDRSTWVRNVLFYNSMPLGLGYLAAILEKAGHQVEIIDSPVQKFSIRDCVQKAKDVSAKLIGITSTTVSFASACKTAFALKEALPNAILALGGSHVSADGAKSIQESSFDIGIIGEGELTFLEIAQKHADGSMLDNIPGTIIRKGNEIVANESRPFIKDLDAVPFPARHLMPKPTEYIPIPNDDIAFPKLSLITSRGCPFSCAFCDHGVFKKIYRETSAEYAVAEFEYLVKQLKARSIAFLDSVFTLHVDRVRAICEGIIRKKIKIPWSCPIRGDIADHSIFQDLAKAGCWRVRIGIESGNSNILASIGKGETLDQIRSAVTAADKAGLSVKGFFVIGHFKDNEKSIRDSIDFACSLPLDDITAQINTPFPNTHLWNELTSGGREPSRDWSRYSLWDPIFVPDGLTPHRLIELQKIFYRSFYLRPGMIVKRLFKPRSIKDIFKIVKFRGLIKELFFQHGFSRS